MLSTSFCLFCVRAALLCFAVVCCYVFLFCVILKGSIGCGFRSLGVQVCMPFCNRLFYSWAWCSYCNAVWYGAVCNSPLKAQSWFHIAASAFKRDLFHLCSMLKVHDGGVNGDGAGDIHDYGGNMVMMILLMIVLHFVMLTGWWWRWWWWS